jgi:hypothetical protein
MRSRAVRLALFVLVVLAFGGATYELVTVDRQAGAARQAAGAFGDAAREVESAISELRAATFAYVAMGQGRAFWSERAGTLLRSVGAELQTLQRTASSADARVSLAAAGEALATVDRFDANIRKYLDEAQHLLASDLIFSDLREATQAAGARVAEARQRETASLTSGLESLRKVQAGTAAGAAAFALLVLALLLPQGRGARQTEQADTSEAAVSPDTSLPGKDIPAGQGLGLAGSPGAQAEAPAMAGLDEPARGGEVNLHAAAALCTDFARLRETRELTALLGRAADVLDAAGIIVWIADRASDELRPALSHGYSAHALARIHGIPKDDDNATARAFRDGALRVVEADGLSNGAIAAPLLTPDGCVGVMAAEIRRGHERRAGVQAMATILAAQLSTLVSNPADAAARVEDSKR